MNKSRTTVIDIARAAGVSKSTVSLVLQKSPLVGRSTRAKVQSAISDLGYVYNRSAAALRGRASPIVGIVVNDLTNSFFAELAVGMDMVVQSAGLVQFLANSGESLDRQREVIASMREHGIAGLILSPAPGTMPADLKPLTEAGIPVVLTVRAVPGAKVSSLVSDNREGMRLGVEHLAGLGHRRIAFLGGFADTMVAAERREGYAEGLAAANLPFDPALVFHGAPSRAGGAAAAEQALGVQPAPTAAICFNDAVAFGACDALRGVRREPGRDFAIVGFDDVIEARTAVPALTTIAVDPQGMGRRAAQMLLRQINAGDALPEAVTGAVRLVVRESSGAKLRQEVQA